MPRTFDPNEFFQKAAYYPSAARGEFTLKVIPRVLKPVVQIRQTVLGTGLGNGLEVGSGVAVGEMTAATSYVALGLSQLESGITAHNGTIPPQTLATNDNFGYTGPGRKMPYNIIYSDLEVTFYLMGKTREEAGALYQTLVHWQEQIAGYRKVGSNQRYNNATYTSTFFSIEYYNNFVAEAEVAVYHQTDPTRPVNRWRYYEVFPINIGALIYDWSNQDQPMTLPVTFAYHYVSSIPENTSSRA